MGKKRKKEKTYFSSARLIKGNHGYYYICLDNRVTVEVTDWFDEEGDECDPEDAASCVGGSDDFGWVTISIKESIESMH